MAVWQTHFQLIPRQALATSADLTTTALQGADWWATAALPSDYRQRLASVAAPAPSSHEGLEAWGSEDGNRVEVWSSDGRVHRASVRVDVRRLDSRFGAAILDFIRVARAVLVRSDGLIVESTISAYAAALRSSDAWRFASDPAAFLASHSTDGDD